MIGALPGVSAPRFFFQVKAVFLSRVLDAALGFLGIIVVGRCLSLQNFGYFAFFTASAVLAQEISGEGLEAALVRFRQGSAKNDSAGPAIWRLKLAVGGLVTLFLCLGALIMKAIPVDPDYASAVVYAAFFSFAFSCYRYLLARLQSDRDFYGYAACLPVLNVLKLLFLLLAAAFSASPQGFYWAFIGAAILAFFLVYRFRSLSLNLSAPRANYRDIFHYAKWVTVSTFVFLLMQRADIFLISALLAPEEVGRYGLAVVLVSGIDNMTVAIKTVLLPGVVQSEHPGQVFPDVKRAVLMILGLFVLLLVAYFFAGDILALLFPGRSDDLLRLFYPLFWASIISLWCDPLLLFLYRQEHPFIFALSNAVAFATGVVLNLWLLPVHGVVAAAYVAVITRAGSRGIQLLYSLGLLGRHYPLLGAVFRGRAQ